MSLVRTQIIEDQRNLILCILGIHELSESMTGSPLASPVLQRRSIAGPVHLGLGSFLNRLVWVVDDGSGAKTTFYIKYISSLSSGFLIYAILYKRMHDNLQYIST